ncbi:MAG: hypothetical protein ACTJHU_08660 [Mycetocola sp.]
MSKRAQRAAAGPQRGQAAAVKAAADQAAVERDAASGAAQSTTVVTQPPRRALIISAAIICVGLAIALVLLGLAVVPGLLRGGAPPSVGTITSQVDGAVARFEWTDPGIEQGDRYLVVIDSGDSRVQDETSIVIDAVPGQDLCLTVQVQRGDEVSAESPESCVGIAAGVD